MLLTGIDGARPIPAQVSGERREFEIAQTVVYAVRCACDVEDNAHLPD